MQKKRNIVREAALFPAKAAFRLVARLLMWLSGRSYHYVFVLGHMRSGSTLLAHILGNHPDFASAGEMHVNYRTPADLPSLAIKTCEFLHRLVLHEAFVVDQINHDFVTDDVLLSDDVYRCIILIRRPEPTLQSMMNLKIWREDEAVNTYVKRLDMLSHYGSVLGRRALLIDYDDLVDHTDETLATLTAFLSVEPPLTSAYTTTRTTGKVGDRSGNISSGRIVRTPGHDHAISAEALAQARNAFVQSRRRLLMSGVQSSLPREELIAAH